MFKVRWFHDGTYETVAMTDRDDAIAAAKGYRLGDRVIVLQKMRRGWHVIFDTASGY